ncbi:hypothetical protein [Breznakia pachnodae]|uniref:hypothetical protein n=1 Tax=Breznakia pachnodae TaxID=265178 RepID=UPI0035214590
MNPIVRQYNQFNATRTRISIHDKKLLRYVLVCSAWNVIFSTNSLKHFMIINV